VRVLNQRAAMRRRRLVAPGWSRPVAQGCGKPVAQGFSPAIRGIGGPSGAGRATIALCVLLIGVIVATAHASTRQAGGATTGNTANGKVVFAKAGCDRCHGENAGGSATAPALAKSSRSLPDFIAYVRKPAGTMPPQSPQVVSDKDLADVYAFLPQQPAPAASSQAAAGAPAGDAKRGRMLFATTGCFQCHGHEGQGGAAGPRLGPSPIPFARFTAYVRQPTGDMPPYTARVLSDQDLAAMYAFLQALPQPPAVSTIPLLVP
jgi:mono/diheme cytochrome c family protein